MGFFSGIGRGIASAWRAVVGAPAVSEDVFDKDNGLLVRAGSWIDGLSYTEQERAVAAAEMARAAQDFVASTLSENTMRSRTRRAIAIVWIRFELALIAASLLAFPIDPEMARYAWELASSEIMVWGTLSVLAFFFGAHILGRGLLSAKTASGAVE